MLYTFSWSMSMLDSYQHHYFVSLVLLCLAFFPPTAAAEIHAAAAVACRIGAQASASSEHELERAARAETLTAGCMRRACC